MSVGPTITGGRAARRRLDQAIRSVGSGLIRSTTFAAAASITPAAVALLPGLAALDVWGSPWSWTSPWSWFGLICILLSVTLVLAHPSAKLFRGLLARWSGLHLADGYHQLPEPVRLSTGFWWNGASYERSRDDARTAQRLRRVLEPAYGREVRWVVLAAFLAGPVCALPAAALIGGVVLLTRPSTPAMASGAVLVILGAALAPLVWRIVPLLAQRWLAAPATLGPSAAELRTQRADLTAAHDAEIRRIERDLHDGAQARLVAVGLDLATAERLMESDPERAMTLLRTARAGTSESLNELRGLVHGVYPPVLIERGLLPAVRALALDSQLDVEIDAPDELRMPSPQEAAVYFGISELLTNISKHAGAPRARIAVHADAGHVEVTVADSGSGGARIQPGGGLDGVRRRLAAFDGTLHVNSPEGGPTTVIMSVPCESS